MTKIILLYFLTGSLAIFSQAESDEAIFSEEETVKSAESMTKDSISDSVDKESLGFSGSINSRNIYTMNRDWLSGVTNSTSQNSMANQIQSNGILEARVRQNYKAILNMTANVYAQGITERHSFTDAVTGNAKQYDETVYADYRFNEAFVDANYANSVYFRAGKQVLIWGKGLFWNPTDVLNAERRSFTDAFQIRQGTYGLKTHIPFGTRANLYAFTGVKNNRAEDVSQALKAEFIIDRTEISLSTVVEQGKVPIYGADVSTRAFTLDLRAEGSLSYGDNQNRTDFINAASGMPNIYQARNTWVTKGSLGGGRSFELFDVADRLTINAEYFYNGAGYNESIFAQPAAVRGYLLQNNIYIPNYYGMHYAGLFTSVRKFFHPDLILSLSALANLSDTSFVAAQSFGFSPGFNFILTWQNNMFFGNNNSEYMASGIGWYTEVSAKIVF